MQTLHQEGHSAAWCRPPSVSSAYRDARSRWDISFSASANNITGGNTLGDVLQTLIQFVSKPISNVFGCTHEMRGMQPRSDGCNTNISKDFSGHTKDMSSLWGSAFSEREGNWCFKLLRGWANNLYTWKLNVGSNLKASSKISTKEDKNYVY